MASNIAAMQEGDDARININNSKISISAGDRRPDSTPTKSENARATTTTVETLDEDDMPTTSGLTQTVNRASETTVSDGNAVAPRDNERQVTSTSTVQSRKRKRQFENMRVASRRDNPPMEWTVSTPADLEGYAKSDVPGTKPEHGNSPHMLLRDAEFEIRRNNAKGARKSLDEALKLIKKQSHPSPDKLLEWAKHCEEKGNYLRAAFFHMMSVFKKSSDPDKEYENCYFTSERIYDAKKLVHQIKITPPDERMETGKPLEIARFVATFLIKMYNVGCSPDQSYGESESRKGYALQWIAVAHLDVKKHKQAKTYARKGKDEMENNMSKEDREKRQTYVRLLKNLAEAHLRDKEYPEAMTHSNQGLSLIDEADYKTEKQREDDKKHLTRIKETAQRKLPGAQ